MEKIQSKFEDIQKKYSQKENIYIEMREEDINYFNLIEFHHHTFIEIIYILKGKMEIDYYFKKEIAKSGDIVVFKQNSTHSTRKLQNVKFLIIQFEPNALFYANYSHSQHYNLLPFFLHDTMHQFFFDIKCKENKLLKQCLNSIYKLDKNDICHEINSKILLLSIIKILIECWKKDGIQSENSKIASKFGFLREYIDIHYFENIEIETLLKKSALSHSYFCKHFKEVFGKSFVQYLNSVRIEKAQTLLKESDLSLTEIAIRCGFNDSNYFIRVFKKETGETPNDYRTN